MAGVSSVPEHDAQGNITNQVLTIRNPEIARVGPPVAFKDSTHVLMERIGLIEIPKWLASMAELTTLRIRCEGVINLDSTPARLINLEVTNSWLRSLPLHLPDGLRNLNLSHNRIDNPAGLEELPYTLRILNLTGNRLQILPKRFPLRLLTKLNLMNNRLSHLPNTLPNTLRELNVSANQIYEWPTRLPQDLRILDLSGNQLTDVNLSVLVKCHQLTSLILNNNHITTIENGFFPRSLRKLMLQDNELCLTEDIALPATLRILNLQFNQITDLSHLKFSQSVSPPLLRGRERQTFAFRTADGRQIRQLHRDRPLTFEDEEENLDDDGLVLTCSNNPGLAVIQEGILPLNLVYLDISECSLVSLPQDLGSRPLESMFASHNALTSLRLDDLPSSLTELVLSHNRIARLFDRTSFVAPGTSLRRLNLSSNALTVIPPSLFRMCQSLYQLKLSANALTEMPSPLPESLSMLSVDQNFLRTLGSENLPSKLSFLDAQRNLITTLSGPALLGTTSVLSELSLEDNPIRYVSPDVRMHLEKISDERKASHERVWGEARHHRSFLEDLPSGTVYADRENVHRHAVQESIRESLTQLRQTGLLNTAPSIDETMKELVGTEIGLLNVHAIMMSAGLLPKEYTVVRPDAESLFEMILPVDKREDDQLIHLGVNILPIAFSDIVRLSWSIIRSHPERETMIRNMVSDLTTPSGRPPCITGLIGALIGCLAGFEGEASKVQINISVAEQMAAIIETTGRQLENSNTYSASAHREAARVEMLERKFDPIEIDVWVAHIELE